MSADVLKRAATLMRERAEYASPSPWRAAERNQVRDRDDDPVVGSPVVPPDADVWHIASWHPDVALAVADWLDFEARVCGQVDADHPAGRALSLLALNVANAYLGETP